MRRLASFVCLTATAALGLSVFVGPAAAKPSDKGSRKRIVNSVNKTTAAGSAAIAGNFDFEVNGRSLSFSLDGAFDFDHRRGFLKLDASALGVAGVSGTLEARIIGTDLYLDLSSLGGSASRGLPQGKKWLHFDLKQTLGQAAGGGLGSTDPTSSLEALRGVSNDVQDLGTEDVRGTPTRHYKADLDPRKAVKKLPANARQKLGKVIEQTFGNSSLPFEIWIDRQGRARRISFELDLSKLSSTSGATGNGSFTLELFDFGRNVDVKAPPSDETADLGDILNQLPTASS